MDFFFPDDLVARLPPEQVQITVLTAEPYPDGRRVRVNLEMTPFQTRPHIEITLTDAEGAEVASTSIIEPLSWKQEFTLHIRGVSEPRGAYTLNALLYYPDGPEAAPRTITFEVPAQ
jgi:hypothetical protein